MFIGKLKILNYVLFLVVFRFILRLYFLQENKIKVDGIEINCLQTGSGEHNVLCLPGLLGNFS